MVIGLNVIALLLGFVVTYVVYLLSEHTLFLFDTFGTPLSDYDLLESDDLNDLVLSLTFDDY